MKKNLLKNYVLDLLESIEQNISAYTNIKKPEYLHRLRVGIKKINAVFSFAENINKIKHNATKLKPLFRKAGKIREKHIHIHLLNTLPEPPERLITRLKEEENMLIHQFIKNSSRYISLIQDFSENVVLPKMLPGKKKIIKYFKKERKKANKILQYKDRACMHRYRKKIKRIMYIYNALPKRMQKSIKLNVAAINKQQTQLGDWHDTYSAIHVFSTEHFSMQTSDYMVKLQEKETRQFNTLLLHLPNKGK